jgi:glycosyltransferase involved in cell wall biosynthesis
MPDLELAPVALERSAGPRVLHLISEFSAKEAMGRTVLETVRRVPGEHHLVTSVAHDGVADFTAVHELGGPLATFPLQVRPALREVLDTVRPDVVHLHVGVLGALLASTEELRAHEVVTTVYAWPTLPRPASWQLASVAQMRASNVLAPRVAITTVLPAPLVRHMLRRSGTRAILSPDPRVLQRLGDRVGDAPVLRLPSGAPQDERRAARATSAPTVVFAGRAETVRGIDTLLAAWPQILAEVPEARLRLLLIPRPELDEIRTAAAAAGPSVEVRTDPVDDLLDELARADVGVWPFKFDYVTSPPAMAVAEAMSVGLPVVSTRVACVEAVVRDGLDGDLVEPGRPHELARAVVALLTDPDRWAARAAAGPAATRERFGWDRAAEATATAYASAGSRSRL